MWKRQLGVLLACMMLGIGCNHDETGRAASEIKLGWLRPSQHRHSGAGSILKKQP
jgi:hypothetical protein